MIRIIGTLNCSQCELIKRILSNKKITYEYFLIDTLDLNDQQYYIGLARQSGKISFPIILKNGKVITIKEI